MIELVKINGWQCGTKKGQFRPGDLGVFFEIDSIPPDTEPLRFLWLCPNSTGPVYNRQLNEPSNAETPQRIELVRGPFRIESWVAQQQNRTKNRRRAN